MKALVYNGPWDLTVETVPDPQPGPGEVLLRVVATGICGSDVHGFSGESGRRSPGQVMGHEVVARVESLGEGVEVGRSYRVGSVVTVNPLISCGTCAACVSGTEQRCAERRVIGVNPEIVAAFAELLVSPVGNVVPLPDEMPVEYGALVEPLSVGYHAARRGSCSATDGVLVLGGGPIGQACVLAARRLGTDRIVVSEPHPQRRTLAASLGARGVDPVSENLADAVHHVLGGPATVVLDAVGTSGSLADAFACSGLGSRVVLVGMNSPQVDLSAYAISTAERSLLGSYSYDAADFRETAEWVGAAPEMLGRLIDGRVGFEDAPASFADLARGTSSTSKVLVFPS